MLSDLMCETGTTYDYLEGYKRMQRHPAFILKPKQFVEFVGGKKAAYLGPLRSVWDGLKSTFSTNTQGRFKSNWECYREGEWIVAPTKVLENNWRVSRGQRLRSLTKLRKAGVLDWCTENYRGSEGQTLSRCKIRLQPENILEIFSKLKAWKDVDVAVKSGGLKLSPRIEIGLGYSLPIADPVVPVSDSVLSVAEKGSDTLPYQASPVRDVATPLADLERNQESGNADKAKLPVKVNFDSQLKDKAKLPEIADSQDVETQIVSAELGEVMRMLRNVFPLGWNRLVINQLKRWNRHFNIDIRLTPETLHEWLSLRDQSRSLQGLPEDSWSLNCDLAYLVKNWYSIRRFVLKYTHYEARVNSMDNLRFLHNLPQHLTSLLEDAKCRFASQKTTHSMHHWLISRWNCETSITEFVVQRFMLMQKTTGCIPELLEKYREALAVKLRDCPVIYFALKEAGYQVDEWLGQLRFFNFYGKLKASVSEIMYANMVSQRWCPFPDVENNSVI